MKNKQFLEDLTRSLLKNVREEKPVGNEPLGRLKDWISERVTLDSDSLPESFDDLHLELQSIWQYGNILNMDPQTAAVYGALWFGVSLLEMARTSEAERRKNEELVEKVRSSTKYKQVLVIIAKNPGIKHQELAEKSNIDKSSLSQLFSRIQGQGLYRVSIIGRNKYYYITDIGKSLLAKIQLRSQDHNDWINLCVTTIYKTMLGEKQNDDKVKELKLTPKPAEALVSPISISDLSTEKFDVMKQKEALFRDIKNSDLSSTVKRNSSLINFASACVAR